MTNQTDSTPLFKTLISRLPYEPYYDGFEICEQAKRVAPLGLIFLSVPIHAEAQLAPFSLLADLNRRGLHVISIVSWFRDRHVVVSRGDRLTNCWEPIFVLSRSPGAPLDREAATKVKKGFEGREGEFDEDEYRTCVGDHWPVRNDRRDRRWLPSGVVLNCGQLAGLASQDKVLDPWGNPGIAEACSVLGWGYEDGGMPNTARSGAGRRAPKLKKAGASPAECSTCGGGQLSCPACNPSENEKKEIEESMNG